MSTRQIAAEYRMTHWAGIMREREESGLSIKQFCKNAGFHENRYFYWQKKLREAACAGIIATQGCTTSMVPMSFAEVKLPAPSALPPIAGALQGQVCIEAGGMRITADGEYPTNKLAELLREVTRIC